MKRFLSAFTIHLNIVLGLFFIVLLYLDKVNPAMNFLGSPEGKFMFVPFCFLSFINSIRLAHNLRKIRLEEYKKARKEQLKRQQEERNSASGKMF